jgi:microcystin-dependent protein
MAINNNQLARIVAPSINDTDYANKMATAFTNINDNFKKIASLPFLQGLQGDSYELKEYHVFEKLSSSQDELKLGNAVLTEEGAVLINAIFNTNFKNGDSLFNLKENTEFILNTVSAFDSFIEGDKIINNSIYFYVITDDSGDVIQNSKHLGQYFYFIDGRVKELGNAYYNDNKTKLINFNDYTGFFQYNPENQSYFKVEIVPTLYYDKDKNDICWKFNNSKTGISAIGATGANGKDTTFYYVLTDVNSSTELSGEIKQVFVENKWVSISELDKEADFNLQNSIALICIKINDKNIDKKDRETMHAFGEIRKVNDGSSWVAYWGNDLVIDSLVTNTSINQYFYKMGYNNEGNFPRYLAIPIDTQRDENDRKAHVLMSDEGDLVLRGVEKAWDDYNNQNLPSLKNTGNLSLKIENYNIDINNHKITNVGEISGTTCNFINGEIGSINSSSIITKGIESLSGSIGALKCNDIDTKTLDATESITSKVNNIEGVEVGMPIGSIIMWPTKTPPSGWLSCNGKCIPLKSDGKTVIDTCSEYQKLANVLLETSKYYVKTPTTNFTSVTGDIIGKGSIVVLPDFQLKFPLGVAIIGNYNSDGTINDSSGNSGAIGISGGSARVKLTAKQSGVPAHTHNIQVVNDADNGIVDDIVYGGGGRLTADDPKGQIYKSGYWKSGQHAIAVDNTPQSAAEYHNNIPPYQTINFIIKYK